MGWFLLHFNLGTFQEIINLNVNSALSECRLSIAWNYTQCLNISAIFLFPNIVLLDGVWKGPTLAFTIPSPFRHLWKLLVLFLSIDYFVFYQCFGSICWIWKFTKLDDLFCLTPQALMAMARTFVWLKGMYHSLFIALSIMLFPNIL